MRQELIKLLDNCYSEIDKFKCSCCVVSREGNKYYGVNIKNSVYRDSIYAEVSAITNAISEGCKKQDLMEIHILSSDKLDVCKSIIKEFFSDDKNIYLYELNKENVNIIKVGDL